MAKHRPEQIRRAILRAVFWNSASPVPNVAREFKLTRQAVQRHMRALAEERAITTSGERRYQRYRLAQLRHASRRYSLTKDFTEDLAWNDLVRPRLADLGLSREESDICHYGLTEMTNNAIDHSASKDVKITIGQTAISLQLIVEDHGIGIFHKVSKALKLADEHYSLLELSKGKFTTDPTRHTGEGLFFTPRMFDRFAIVSGAIRFVHVLGKDAWTTEDTRKVFAGTTVYMELLLPAERSMQEVFASFSSGPEDYRFAKTHVPLRLATFGDESLISRSSARRVLARADRFDEVTLDFAGIRSIGQAFADEMFRVFQAEYPAVVLKPVHANSQINAMISRAVAARNQNR